MLLRDVKISAVCSFVSSQSMRVTDRQTDGQNYNLQDRASIAASRGKNWMYLKYSVYLTTAIYTMLYYISSSSVIL